MASSSRTKLREQFEIRPRRIHLNNAGIAPMTRAGQSAAIEAVKRMSRDAFIGFMSELEQYEKSRESFARIIGTRAANVAMLPSCAYAVNLVAHGMSLKPGDEIVQWDQEYPSNAYPWIHAATKAGAKLVRVSSESGYDIHTEKLLEAIGPQTRVVAISWIQFRTGAATDLKAVAKQCQRFGTWLVVDVIQGLGVIPFNMTELGVDAVCGGTYKWLCGPMGHGFLAVAEHRIRELTPIIQGAMTYGMPYDPVDPARPPKTDAHRFEPGAPLVLGTAAGAASIEVLLKTGIDSIHARSLSLADRLVKGLQQLGFRLLLPKERLSPIVTFDAGDGAQGMSAHLLQKGISHGLNGPLIRVSPHGFNTETEISLFLKTLRDAAKPAKRATPPKTRKKGSRG